MLEYMRRIHRDTFYSQLNRDVLHCIDTLSTLSHSGPKMCWQNVNIFFFLNLSNFYISSSIPNIDFLGSVAAFRISQLTGIYEFWKTTVIFQRDQFQNGPKDSF